MSCDHIFWIRSRSYDFIWSLHWDHWWGEWVSIIFLKIMFFCVVFAWKTFDFRSVYYRQHHTAKNEWKPYSLTYVDHHWGVKAREFHVFRAENSDRERIPTDGWTKGNKRFPFPELSLDLGEPSFCHCLDILAKDVSGREMQFHGRYNAIYEFRCGLQTFKHENGEYTLYVDNRYGWVILNKSDRVLPSFRGQIQPALTLCPADQRYQIF